MLNATDNGLGEHGLPLLVVHVIWTVALLYCPGTAFRSTAKVTYKGWAVEEGMEKGLLMGNKGSGRHPPPLPAYRGE